MKRVIILALLTGSFLMTGCSDLFEPANENFKDLSQMTTEPNFGQSFLTRGYSAIPSYIQDWDYATDDAVTNDYTSSYLKMATGTWTSSNDPLSRWDASYAAILYLNQYIENGVDIDYVNDLSVRELINMRTRGEAFGLRALHMYLLLRSHAGYTDDGRLMGVPIINEFLESDADFNIPRSTFMECVQQALDDLATAEELLPDDYNDLADGAEVPEKYQSITTSWELYNNAMGNDARQLLNGMIAKAIRSRLLLMAASPQFQDASNTVTWEDAADAAAEVIDLKGGISGLAANGVTWYTNTDEISNLAEGANPDEMIWRENVQTNNTDLEDKHYPPTLFGNGRMNPTQNLVDAFPMANGYPIDNAASGYDSSNPYSNRDPRLYDYIIYNGATEGPSSSTIYTGSQSGTEDGLNVISTSTRTGYYMKKFLIMSVNCNPVSTSGQTHYRPRIRATEIFLNYAEAANEAWGPTGTGTHGYSAYDVIKAIRQRAGVGGTSDRYLETCAADQDLMRELIHNERRLELCFEGFRIWDLRRWKADMNETARGVDVNGSTYTYMDVEERAYKDYMYYGPIPYTETLKFNNLEQNKGW
ncbi:MAG: RagB/SusD family nutrient uptake outer membrane protein [Prevotellaceae bacterium]|nr:RagB/SusD family nutrient uptake outer membrane protein [Prevotellaceae bacterium]